MTPYILFQKVIDHCTAYKKFINQSVKKNTKFEDIPCIDKANYLNQYPLEELIYKEKSVSDHYMVCTSSGSTDKPFVWLRDYDYDQKIPKGFIAFLDHHFQIKTKRTLVVIGHAMGTTQAGMMNSMASWKGAQHHQISVITPSCDPELTCFLVNKLALSYDQVVCVGYPAVITDFIDLAIKQNLPVTKWHIKIAFSGDSASGLWRMNQAQKIGGKLSDIVSFYGTTEGGMIGFETKETNEITNACINNFDLSMNLFNTPNPPILIQTNPKKKFVEIINQEIVMTVDQPIPLIRYNVHDKGIFISTTTIKTELQKQKLKSDFINPGHRTYLAVFGRSLDKIFSIENIRQAIESLQASEQYISEFQYGEKYQGNTVITTLILYKKSDKAITESENDSIQRQVKHYLSNISSHIDIQINLILKTESEAKGYINGKLKYLL